MSRRSLATAIAVPLMVGLWVAAALVPVPYVTYHPGSTTDMLSETGGKERIQVVGHQAYYDDAGAELFLVPDANCAAALGAPRGDMRLVRVKTMPDALKSIQTWVEDPKADLPSCEKE